MNDGRLKSPLPVKFQRVGGALASLWRKLAGRGALGRPCATRFLFCTNLFLSLLLLTSCLPKHRVTFERRISPPEKKEMKKEPVPEEKTTVAKIDVDRAEKRETRGVQYGIASWYGPDFHGKPTSSGEIYDMYQLSCAHNALALGSTVIVTNLENGKSLELKVNDRGPFAKDRILRPLVCGR